MDQLVNVLLFINKAHTVPQRAMDCGPGFGGLNQVYAPNLSHSHMCYNILIKESVEGYHAQHEFAPVTALSCLLHGLGGGSHILTIFTQNKFIFLDAEISRPKD